MPTSNSRSRFVDHFLLLIFAVSAATISPSVTTADDPIDFRRQVQPILSDRCFHCHGPDSKNQDSAYRMDSQENLFADLGGYAAIVPGDLTESELHTRIRSTDEYEMMPPPDSNRSLSDAEKDILDQWIKQGAPYQGHWSFDAPLLPTVPQNAVAESDWPAATKKLWSQNPIDAFVAQPLIEKNWAPSPPAESSTLLRRVAMTLTGMLPPRELQDRFLKNPSDEAYQAAVDELLGSMAYAEHQTLRWLDAARYADTDGYQNDYERTNWPWRDWVIQAMHENMPFDQFTIEQLAGDMLPAATPSQRLATAFNRNHRQNGEGGALAEEFEVENAIDRVETTSTVWLGLTMGCCRCHDHKYDPFSQREFYQFYGYFNNIGERGIGRGIEANPTMESFSPLVHVDPQLLAACDAAKKQVADAKNGFDLRMEAWIKQQPKEQVARETSWTKATIADAKLAGDGELTVNTKDQSVQYTAGNNATNVTYTLTINTELLQLTALQLDALVDPNFGKPRQLAPSDNGNFVLTDIQILVAGQPQKIESGFASFEQDKYPLKASFDGKPKSGWAVFGPDVKAEPVSATFRLSESVKLAESELIVLKLKFGSQFPNHSIGKFQIQLSGDEHAGAPTKDGLLPDVQSAIAKPAKSRNKKDKKAIRNYYETIDEPLQQPMAELKKSEADLHRNSGPNATVMVMSERDDVAPIYLLNRGQYNEPVKDDPLTRGVPVALLSKDDKSTQPGDRLEFARWLVSRENPLTARVMVNRIWQDHFGVGLVKTSDDFGLQGESPSHPELLDWLAIEFIESGWDVQAMHRLIVTSAAYEQSSRRDKQHEADDPENRLISRGPRYRADGFAIRDMALQSAGLLSEKVGGPSVKPYQPSGLWETLAANVGTQYTEDKGESLYRKSMYTYWKRAVNPPRQTIFDASGREVCNVQSRRTNTPLQALVLMNDPTFVESARKLAERTLVGDAANDRQRIGKVYRFAIGHEADDETLSILQENLDYFREHYAADPESADKLLAVGTSKRDQSLNPVELASLTAVAHLILNLDEFLTVE